MHPFQQYFPDHWNEWIKEYSLKNSDEKYETLGASDFTHSLRIKFEDASELYFSSAFYAINEEYSEVAVFSEHCGYHIFDTLSIIEFLDGEGNMVEPVAGGDAAR